MTCLLGHNPVYQLLYIMCPPRILLRTTAILLLPIAHGLASPQQRLLGKRGNVASLSEWASAQGVQFASGIEIIQRTDNNWQIACQTSEPLEQGLVVLSVPNTLILKSHAIVQEMGREALDEAFQTLTKGGFGDQLGEFLIFLKILKEWDQGKKSPWNAWIQCLPRDFTTAVCFDKEELNCLPSFSRTLADFEIKKLQAFCHCADLVRSCWEQNRVNTNQQRKTLYPWAYNVVYTRCWKFSDELESGTTEMVPIGDLFNHKDPPTVAVEASPDSSTVDFVLQTPGPVQELSLSYGLTNPHRFLVIFGFVDETMPELFSQVVFPDATPQHIALGCNDRSKMVYATEDGAISGTIWDSVLYALLASKPDEQQALYDAHQQGDVETKKALYSKYLLETSLTLRNHVDGTLKELELLQQHIEKTKGTGKHPNLPLVEKHNGFLQSVFRKVKLRLDAMVQEETTRRRSVIQQ
jgi:hypothetical protein